MRFKRTLTTVLLCARLNLAISHAINGHPYHPHVHKRAAVAVVSSIVTDVVTVTDYNAVVWVDQAGNIVRTEHNTPVTSSAAVAITSTATSLPSPTVTSVAAQSADVSAIEVQHGNQAIWSPESTVDPTSAPDPAPTSAPDSASPPLSPSVSSVDVSPSIATTDATTSSSAIQQGSSTSSQTSKNTAGPLQGFGVAYDAWTGSGCRPTLDGEFAFLASQGVGFIRVYDNCFAEAATAAAVQNLKLMVGLTSFTDFDANLGRLADAVMSTSSNDAGAGWSVVDTVFVGNELVNTQQASSVEVAAKVSYARGILKTKGFTGNVVTVDTWTAMRDDPIICSTSDYCAANAHAFFDGNVLPADAGRFVRAAQAAVATANTGKTRVVISESGWPHAGDSDGLAVPSVDNQHVAIASIITEFTSTSAAVGGVNDDDPADVYLFMAYDAKYKTTGAEIERNFGIFDVDHYTGLP